MMMAKDYPYNLLMEARGAQMLELPPTLTKDVQAGIAYALFTLEEEERNVLDKKFRLGFPLDNEQWQIEKKALKKLCRSCRWDYIRYGVAGCLKKKAVETKRKGYIQGYQAGYAVGVKAHVIKLETQTVVSAMDLPIETMPLSTRTRNALRRSGCKIVRDVATQNIAAIQRMRNLGERGGKEVLQALHSYGLTHTQWELL